MLKTSFLFSYYDKLLVRLGCIQKAFMSKKEAFLPVKPGEAFVWLFIGERLYVKMFASLNVQIDNLVLS